jgi:histone H3/H4
MSELLVVRSNIKKSTKLNVASDFADALSKIVEMKIKKAEERATGNGRKTLKPIDL